MCYICAMAVMNIRLPDDLRNQFKAMCAARGTNMREEIHKMIQTAVAKGGKKKPS